MEELRRFNVDCYEWLKQIPPQHWSRSHFTGRAKCDILLNNLCESFNKELVGARDQPIITCLEFVREYLMKRIVLVQEVIANTEGPLTPTATRIFEAIKTAAGPYKAIWNGGTLYQVNGPWNEQCVVDVRERHCTCRKWDLTGFPCKHAVATIWNMSLNGQDVGIPEDWVHPCYRLQTWKEVYEFKINPTTSMTYWSKSDCPTKLVPPYHHKQVGRPKKKRRKTAEEMSQATEYQSVVQAGKITRAGKTLTCSKCKNKGHNARGCTGQGGTVSLRTLQRRKRKHPDSTAGIGPSQPSAPTGPSQASRTSNVGASGGNVGTSQTRPRTRASQANASGGEGGSQARSSVGEGGSQSSKRTKGTARKRVINV